MTVRWMIQRLDRRLQRATFDCGNPQLNHWLAQLAGQFERRDLSRTWVATRPGESVVLGYYALSTHRVVFTDLDQDQAQGLPQIDLPVILIGRLAVDRSVQGEGLGAHLLVDALRRILQVSDEVGVRAVEVDAIDEAAVRFYRKFGFRPLLDDSRHLFMPLHEIRKLPF